MNTLNDVGIEVSAEPVGILSAEMCSGVADRQGDTLKDKWKVFAMGQVLSTWGDGGDGEDVDWGGGWYDTGDTRDDAAVTLFDALMDCSSDAEAEEVMDRYDVVIWSPFEDWSTADVVAMVFNLADSAQYTDEVVR